LCMKELSPVLRLGYFFKLWLLAAYWQIHCSPDRLGILVGLFFTRCFLINSSRSSSVKYTEFLPILIQARFPLCTCSITVCLHMLNIVATSFRGNSNLLSLR